MWTDAALLVGLGFAAGYGIRAWISTSSIFNGLYFCIPTDDGGNPFGLKFIRSNIAPMSRKPTAAFGGDLAKSVDWTVLHGLDEDGCTSEHHRFQLPWKATMDRIRLICGYVTSFLDSTGVGDPIAGAAAGRQ